MQILKHRKHRIRAIRKAPKGPQLYRPKEPYNGMLFEFNPYDDDDHPSVPHGDSLDHRYKIDLKNGDIFEGRKKTGHLNKKEFERLKRDKRIKDIIRTAQIYYREHHPEILFDPIPWCEKETIVRAFSRKKAKVIFFRLQVEFD